jgi:hypothetical protein
LKQQAGTTTIPAMTSIALTPAAEGKPKALERVIDWESVERDYRAGMMSVREIAVQHKISHTAIQKKAKDQKWDRDLQAKIKAKADAIVAKRLVAKEIAAGNQITEQLVIDAGAQRIAQIKTAHRQDIERARDLTKSLLDELELQTADPELLAQLGELMRDPESNSDRLNDLYKKIVATPGRIDSTKKLVETMRTVVTMEREAYGIDSSPAEVAQSGIAAFLAGLKRSALPVVVDISDDEDD